MKDPSEGIKIPAYIEVEKDRFVPIGKLEGDQEASLAALRFEFCRAGWTAPNLEESLLNLVAKAKYLGVYDVLRSQILDVIE